MAVRVNCPQCDQSYTLRDELIGKTVRCKTCGEVFPVTANLEDDEFEIVEDSVPDPRQSKRAPTKLRKQDSSQSSVLKWVLVGLGTVVVFFVATCGGLIIIGHRAAQKVQEQQREQAVAVKSDIPPAGGPSELFPVERYPMPEFPDLQPGQLIDGSGVTVRTVTILPKPEKVLQPGFQTQMRIYLPEGQHAPGTLPLVLVAPAGTPLFVGNRLDDPEYHDETLPY